MVKMAKALTYWEAAPLSPSERKTSRRLLFTREFKIMSFIVDVSNILCCICTDVRLLPSSAAAAPGLLLD